MVTLASSVVELRTVMMLATSRFSHRPHLRQASTRASYKKSTAVLQIGTWQPQQMPVHGLCDPVSPSLLAYLGAGNRYTSKPGTTKVRVTEHLINEELSEVWE